MFIILPKNKNIGLVSRIAGADNGIHPIGPDQVGNEFEANQLHPFDSLILMECFISLGFRPSRTARPATISWFQWMESKRNRDNFG